MKQASNLWHLRPISILAKLQIRFCFVTCEMRISPASID